MPKNIRYYATINWFVFKFFSIVQNIWMDVRSVWMHGVIHLSAANWLKRGSSLGQRIVLARILGAADIGHIGVVNALLSLFSMPAGAGTFTVVNQMMAENDGDVKKQREVMGTTIWINICSSMLVCIGAWFFLTNTRLIGDPVASNLIKILLFFLPMIIFGQVFQSALIGQQRIKVVSNIRAATSIIAIAGVIPMALVWALNGWLYNQIVVILFGLFVCLWLMRGVLSMRWNSKLAIRMMFIGGFSFASQLVGRFIFQIDTLSVSGIIKDPVQTGIYNTAALAAQQMMVFPVSVLQVVFPFVAKNRQDFEKLKRRYNELIKKIFYLAVVTCIGANIFSKMIFSVFGQEFLSAVPAFRILSIGLVARCINMLDNTYLDALGRTDIDFYARLVSATFAVGLNFFMIPRWFLIGAGWATTISIIFNLVLSHMAVRYFIFHKKAIR